MTPERIGPYHLERLLGTGGMGSVYLGRHRDAGYLAAVKVLPAAMAREEGFVVRFQREVEALRQLKSPHIVQLYDDGADDGTYYYAMEYVDGETLTDLLKRERRLPWREVIAMTLQMCAALKAAHDAGIIHRDLKPSNLLISADRTIKLSDFGVAQVFAASRLTVTGGIIGTAEYMSPEQAQGKRASRRSDLYSLGAVMYVMLTGRPPFSGESAIEVLKKHQFGQFDRPRNFVPELPSWLDELVCQMLEKDPEKRPPDAYVVSKRLQEIVAKVELQKSQDSLEAPLSDGETRLAGGGEQIVGATLMRDVIRGELSRDARTDGLHGLFNNLWVLLGLLALLVAGGIYTLRGRELNSEQRFARGVKLMEQPPGREWLQARNDYFLPLIEEDPERWKPQVSNYLDDIALYEAESRVTNRRRSGARTKASEPERWLGQVRSRWDAGDLPGAYRLLNEVRPLLEADDQSEPLRKLATRWSDMLQTQLAEASDVEAYLKRILQAADAVAQEDPERAQQIWKSVIELYQLHPTAGEWVAIARLRLQMLDGGSKTGNDKK
ncbi:serine/threonine-protein kinase [Planctellipticum variicoloris]|uniref:serine/threonine-protein kinase n=1 Tax=Planctellipticum variicoloris TaxID=3064265 RepID=UPI003013EC7E|nr:serine/threonine protein kinase [Planctomycetaceae bacterium SH412]